MQLEILTSPSVEVLQIELDRLRRDYPAMDTTPINDIEVYKQANMKPGTRLSIVIDGPTLAFVLESPHLSQ